MLLAFQCNLTVSTRELGLTRDRYSKAALRSLLRSRVGSLGWNRTGPWPIRTPLQQLVDEFSERLASGAEQNIQRYFASRPASGITAGGRRAVSGPLRYTQDRQRIAADDVGALGEGVAGYYLENIARLQFEIRPFDISPDFIFRDPITSSLILCEVKTSLEVWPRTIYTNAIELLEVLSKTWFINPGRYAACVIHVKIVSPTDFELRRLALEVA